MNQFLRLLLIGVAVLLPGREVSGSERCFKLHLAEFRAGNDDHRTVPPVKLMEYDTKTGAEVRLNRYFRDKINMIWCDASDFEEDRRGFPAETVDRDFVDVTSCPAVVAILKQNAMNLNRGQRRFTCHASSNQVIVFSNAGVTPPTQDPRPDDIFLQMYCVYNTTSGQIAFVDSMYVSYEQFDGLDSFWDRGMFDATGKYFYYPKRGGVLRFNTREQYLDTIPIGTDPVIPWNSTEIVVYDAHSKEFSLLNENLNILKKAPGPFRGEKLTVYGVDSMTFVFGETHWCWGPPWWNHPHEHFYVIDFSKGEVEKIFENSGPCQILRAEEIK